MAPTRRVSILLASILGAGMVILPGCEITVGPPISADSESLEDTESPLRDGSSEDDSGDDGANGPGGSSSPGDSEDENASSGDDDDEEGADVVESGDEGSEGAEVEEGAVESGDGDEASEPAEVESGDESEPASGDEPVEVESGDEPAEDSPGDEEPADDSSSSDEGAEGAGPDFELDIPEKSIICGLGYGKCSDICAFGFENNCYWMSPISKLTPSQKCGCKLPEIEFDDEIIPEIFEDEPEPWIPDVEIFEDEDPIKPEILDDEPELPKKPETLPEVLSELDSDDVDKAIEKMHDGVTMDDVTSTIPELLEKTDLGELGELFVDAVLGAAGDGAEEPKFEKEMLEPKFEKELLDDDFVYETSFAEVLLEKPSSAIDDKPTDPIMTGKPGHDKPQQNDDFLPWHREFEAILGDLLHEVSEIILSNRPDGFDPTDGSHTAKSLWGIVVNAFNSGDADYRVAVLGQANGLLSELADALESKFDMEKMVATNQEYNFFPTAAWMMEASFRRSTQKLWTITEFMDTLTCDRVKFFFDMLHTDFSQYPAESNGDALEPGPDRNAFRVLIPAFVRAIDWSDYFALKGLIVENGKEWSPLSGQQLVNLIEDYILNGLIVENGWSPEFVTMGKAQGVIILDRPRLNEVIIKNFNNYWNEAVISRIENGNLYEEDDLDEMDLHLIIEKYGAIEKLQPQPKLGGIIVGTPADTVVEKYEAIEKIEFDDDFSSFIQKVEAVDEPIEKIEEFDPNVDSAECSNDNDCSPINLCVDGVCVGGSTKPAAVFARMVNVFADVSNTAFRINHFKVIEKIDDEYSFSSFVEKSEAVEDAKEGESLVVYKLPPLFHTVGDKNLYDLKETVNNLRSAAWWIIGDAGYMLSTKKPLPGFQNPSGQGDDDDEFCSNAGSFFASLRPDAVRPNSTPGNGIIIDKDGTTLPGYHELSPEIDLDAIEKIAVEKVAPEFDLGAVEKGASTPIINPPMGMYEEVQWS